jgi:hypothetical protein
MISASLNPARPRAVGRGITISIGQYWNRLPLCAILLLATILDFFGLSREGYMELPRFSREFTTWS